MGQLSRLINRIQGPRLLISNLPGSALSENDFELFGKPRDSTGVLQVLPGKRDIKRHTPTILYISLNPLIWQHQRIMAKKVTVSDCHIQNNQDIILNMTCSFSLGYICV